MMKSYLRLSVILAISLISFSIIAEEKIPRPAVSPEQSLLPMLLGLAGILVLIVLLASVMKKLTGLNVVSNNIKVIESQNLGAKEKLVIVEIQKQQYVLGVTTHSINQICQLSEPIEKKPSMPSFENMMQQFLSPKKNNSQSLPENKKNQSGSR